MKKLNNKGFAISTVIYGLAIMGIMIVAILMATMAQNRSNTSQLAKSIEEELTRFSRSETAFRTSIGDNNLPTAQEYIVPESGWYRIELWGSSNGGNGAYTSGVIELNEGEIIYFYVGKDGAETDVRKKAGAYADDFNSYSSRIMVAAGAGSGTYADGGTLYGYNTNMKSQGGVIKTQGNDKDFSLLPKSDSTNYSNGSQMGFSSSYQESSTNYDNKLEIQVPSPRGTNGGGDGMIPSHSSTTGGVSYIAGYAGCLGVYDGNFIESPIYKQTEDDESSTNVREYYFVDGLMLAGVNNGDGHAKISKVATKKSETSSLVKKNTKLNNVRYIKDCISKYNIGTDAPYGNIDISTTPLEWEIAVISNGMDIIKENNIALNSISYDQGYCIKVDLGDTYNIDEIAVWHHTSGVSPITHTVDVSANDITSNNTTTTATLKRIGVADADPMTFLSETETVTGMRFSAYQYDTTENFPSSGNYIIIPVLSENKVFTAGKTAENSADPIDIEYYNGYNRQIWNIEKITDHSISSTDDEYKIVELARFKALSISNDENLMFNTMSAVDTFNKYARNDPQIWKIEKLGDGTYFIKTVINSSTGDPNIGYLSAQTNQNISDAKNQIIIGKKNNNTTKFKLISVDYSSN